MSSGRRREKPTAFLEFRGISARNIRGADIRIPLGRLTVLTGVSGAGKSTFIEEVFVPTVATGIPANCAAFDGCKGEVIVVDQSPIGINPRSTPLTYVGLGEIVRDFFSRETDLGPSCFSFNTADGACPECGGMGATEVKMRYLAPEWIVCGRCGGKRFASDVLERRVRMGGRALNIAEFCDLSVETARRLLASFGGLSRASREKALGILDALIAVGLGYLRLGQSSPTLSGGEAQRVKLSKFMGRLGKRIPILVMDEPSSGLHPADIGNLLSALSLIVDRGSTAVVVEHDTDIIRAADWIVDLGPGAGNLGGAVMYEGPYERLAEEKRSLTAAAIREENAPGVFPARRNEANAPRKAFGRIVISGARANNLKSVSVSIPKRALTVITGRSGSGKSSLVQGVLEAESRRRFYECASMYERQGCKEGPEAEVDDVSGMGMTFSVIPSRMSFGRRAAVGNVSELTFHLAKIYAFAGNRFCPDCGAEVERRESSPCPKCGRSLTGLAQSSFIPDNYESACPACHGVGTVQVPSPSKLIVEPDKPLCKGAMYSPGFFPQGFLGKPFNSGYYIVRALAEKYRFDPEKTPWSGMSAAARKAFLFGDPEPIIVHGENRKGIARDYALEYRGFYGHFLGEWDAEGTFTDTVPCAECGGSRLRKEFSVVTLFGKTIRDAWSMPISSLGSLFRGHLGAMAREVKKNALAIIRKADFMDAVGLGYLSIDRRFATLSAGEAQRVKLAKLLGNELESLTVLMDEPSRGLHPSEAESVAKALRAIKDAGNTVIVVDHDEKIIAAADYIIELGPGSGTDGGRIVAEGTIAKIRQGRSETAEVLRGSCAAAVRSEPFKAKGFISLRGAAENNLKGIDVDIPLGALTGVCGKSGSGKSTLIIDTLARIVAPVKHTTSVASEPLKPGRYRSISGDIPARAIVVDQSLAEVRSPFRYLSLDARVNKIYAESADAHALGIGADSIARGCASCGGKGYVSIDMGFLPDIHNGCEACGGSGISAEAAGIRVRGHTLPELLGMTIREVRGLFEDDPLLPFLLGTACDLGLGYLALRQPGHSLSGGELQRLKLARALCKEGADQLFILDEPTYGLHAKDVAALIAALRDIVAKGGSVLVVEHDPLLLASCDWIIELGPGAGSAGGNVIAAGTPRAVAALATPTAPYLAAYLEDRSP